nr:tripartite tricarboxylate transporter permease [Paraburkholderia sp. ZP32-5]
MEQAIIELYHGFGIALQFQNLVWVIAGVLVGNLVGVLPGMGALSAISMLLPLTYPLSPVAAVLMLAGVFYGSMYGGAIGAILLNLPSHPPHAVTCLDGYPLARQGRGGAALGITMMASFFAASVGIVFMIFLSPILVDMAAGFGPAEITSIMLLGLIAGSTMSQGSPLKGIGMTLFGLICGTVGTDLTTGIVRFSFGAPDLSDGVELGALCMGLFGLAYFMLQANRLADVEESPKVTMRDMWPTKRELKKSIAPTLRGTLVGTLFGALPGTGPTITSFLAYAVERRVSKSADRFGKGELAGVAGPEAAAHAKTQMDFIPTMSLGIPGDAIMALLLGALIIKGIQPGPQLIVEHPDIFWGLIASFWIGNLLLMILNVPLIGVWVKLLRVPFRFLFPLAIFFICVGVYCARNSLFDVAEVAVFGIIGAVLSKLDFPLSSIVLGYVLGPMLEENFRRTLLLSDGGFQIFLQRPVSAAFLLIGAAILVIQLYKFSTRSRRVTPRGSVPL